MTEWVQPSRHLTSGLVLVLSDGTPQDIMGWNSEHALESSRPGFGSLPQDCGGHGKTPSFPGHV